MKRRKVLTVAYEDAVIMTLMRAWEADARQRRLGGDDRHLVAEEPSDVGDRRHQRRSDSSPRDGLDRFTRTLSRLRGIPE